MSTEQPAPGGNVPLVDKVLALGSGAVQNFTPVKQVCETVCGLHCYAHDPSRQVEAHHFCSHLTGEVRQCVIYDGTGKDARLIGVEYIISRTLFETLPPEERKYWHSHKFEVESGMLVAPGLPEVLELEALQKLVDTYGKTWHLWQVDRGDPLPFGPPQLMSSFTADGQVDKDLLRKVHGKFGYDTAAIRTARQKLTYPEKLPEGCDVLWNTGKGWQAEMADRELQKKT